MGTSVQCPGTYFDGATSAAHPVMLILDDTGIAVTTQDGTTLTRWSYSSIEQLTAPRHRLRFGLAGNPSTARIEVRNPASVDVAKERIGFLTDQAERSERLRRHRIVEWSIAAIAVLLLMGVLGIPAFAELLLPLVPLSAEEQIGKVQHQYLKQHFKEQGPFECGETGEQEETKQKEERGKAVFLQLVRRLEAAAALPFPVQPFVVRSKEVNAFALPGGYIHIYKGLIDFAESPDELGGVVAHELGHIAHRDAMGSYLRNTGVTILIATTVGDVVGHWGLTLAASGLFRNRYSRAQESAADAFSVHLMTELGADPHRVAELFERMQDNADFPLLRDHPTNASRIAAIRAAPAVQNPKPLLSADEWQALKQVCSRK
jgi:Zn-dependent protease with chaperone function